MRESQRMNPIFITAKWQQHIDLMSHLSQFSQDVLLMISSEKGGKTTLAHYFSELEVPLVKKALVTADKNKSWQALFAQIIEVFEIDPPIPCDTIEDLQSILKNQYEEEKLHFVLLVDDAHLLDDESLQNIVKLSTFDGSFSPLHLILFAAPSLEMTLFSPQYHPLIEGRLYTIEIEPWTLEETIAYFEQNALSISDEEATRIFERSNGLPGFIAKELKFILRSPPKTGNNMKKLNFKWFNRPILIGIVVGVTVGMTYLFINNVEEEGSTSIPLDMAQLAESEWENQDNPKKNSVHFEFDKSLNQTETNDEPDVVSDTQAVPALEQTDAQLLDPEMMEEVPDSLAVLDKPKIESKKPLAMAAPSASSPSLTPKEQQLLNTASHHYTIQLLGARSEESIKQFIQQHAIENQAHYYRTQLDGKDWYVMVYGNFSSRDAAKEAIAKLPDSLQNEKLHPWIRELSHIQQDIREGHPA